jgi:hypothetical protein
MNNYYIQNVAGGNRMRFRLTRRGMSTAALRHAIECGACGGPLFSGAAAAEAEAEYDEIYEQYLMGQCTPRVEAMFTRCTQ